MELCNILSDFTKGIFGCNNLRNICEIQERQIRGEKRSPERSGRVSCCSAEEVLSQYLPMPLVWPPSLNQSLSPQTPRLLLLLLQQESKLSRALGGGGVSFSSKEGPPVQHVKVLFYSYMGIQCRPAWPLPGVVISHQADQRTTVGSERTLTRKSPSGWQAIAHPLTGSRSPSDCCFRSRLLPEMWRERLTWLPGKQNSNRSHTTSPRLRTTSSQCSNTTGHSIASKTKEVDQPHQRKCFAKFPPQTHVSHDQVWPSPCHWKPNGLGLIASYLFMWSAP